MKKFIINNVEVEFKAIENEIFTSSLQIAEVFGKKHTEVVADIDDMSVDFEIRDDSHKVDELYSQSVKWGKYTDEKRPRRGHVSALQRRLHVFIYEI